MDSVIECHQTEKCHCKSNKTGITTTSFKKFMCMTLNFFQSEPLDLSTLICKRGNSTYDHCSTRMLIAGPTPNNCSLVCVTQGMNGLPMEFFFFSIREVTLDCFKFQQAQSDTKSLVQMFFLKSRSATHYFELSFFLKISLISYCFQGSQIVFNQ